MERDRDKGRETDSQNSKSLYHVCRRGTVARPEEVGTNPRSCSLQMTWPQPYAEPSTAYGFVVIKNRRKPSEVQCEASMKPPHFTVKENQGYFVTNFYSFQEGH